MATSYTNLWRIAVLSPLDPATANSWGSIQDQSMSLFEQGAVGITAVNIAGLTTYSLTTANNATDQARYLVQQYTGALANNCTVTIPNLQRVGWAQNSTTGAHNVILSAGGTTATIPPDGQWYMFSCDGATNVSLVSIAIGQGNVSVGGTLNVTGTTSVGSTLNVAGTLVGHGGSFTNLDATGTLHVSAAANFDATVTVNGGAATPVANTGAYGQFVVAYNVSTSVTYSLIAVNSIIANTLWATSDARVKTDIKEISADDAYDWVLKGRPVTYMKSGSHHEAGFLAQDELRSGRGASISMVADASMVATDELSPAGMRLVKNYEHEIAYLTAALQGALKRLSALEMATDPSRHP